MATSRKDIRISTDIDPDLIDLTLDPARLKQVLYNYLSNAIKFTTAGGQVAVRAMAEGPEHFRIEVEDTGIGISAISSPTRSRPWLLGRLKLCNRYVLHISVKQIRMTSKASRLSHFRGLSTTDPAPAEPSTRW